VFKRKGADLYMQKDISLREALGGTKFEFIHLDNKPIKVTSPTYKVINHGEIMCIEQLGMPFFQRPLKFGNLFITFQIVFPKSLSKDQINVIRECLHSKEQDTRYDPSAKTEHKLRFYEGTEQEFGERLTKHKRGKFIFLKTYSILLIYFSI